MAEAAYSFNIDSKWDIQTNLASLNFVIDDPELITTWWGAVFLKVEILEGDYYSDEGLKVRLWTKGLMPHSFKFIARVFHNKQQNQIIVKTDGDFTGVGTITLKSVDADNSQIQINWRTCVNNHYLYPLMMLLKPIFVANHRWAMRRGEQGIKTELEHRKTAAKNTARQLQKPSFPHRFMAAK